MLQRLFIFFFSVSVLGILPSCQSNKIPCPTYADSFPQKKKKKKPEPPKIPKVTKPKSSVLPPGYKGD